MREFRTVLLLVVVGGLIIFAVQNTSPSLALVFLGMKSIPLPLSVWVLGAIALGAVTSWVMEILLRLYAHWAAKDSRPRRGRSPYRDPIEPSPEPPASWSPSARNPQAETPPPSGRTWDPNATHLQDNDPGEPFRPTSAEEFDDDKNWIDEDEEFFEEIDSDAYNYEVVQEPRSESWSGSMYSYSYRDRGESPDEDRESPGETEARIITPPASEPPPSPEQEEEDNASQIPPPSPENQTASEPQPAENWQSEPQGQDDWTTKRSKADWEEW